MTIFWIHLIVVTIIAENTEITEQTFVSVGYYPDYKNKDLNLPECGLRYVPRNIHTFNYNSECFGNKYKTRTFVDYSESRKQKSVDSTSNRIYMGTDVEVGESPFTVFLRHENQVCTGSLLTFEWVITAAHCLTARFERKGALTVWAGSVQPFKGDSIEGNINKVFFHPHVNKNLKRYDIALLKLKHKFNGHKTIGQNYMINTICLPEFAKFIYNKEFATVFGFGVKSVAHELERTPSYLQKFELKLIADKPIHETDEFQWHIIVSTSGDIPSICSGDSGGPLVQYIDHKNWSRAVLVGITSLSSPIIATCSHQKISNYFKPISKHIDWILKAIREN